jgi:hypothetical protein
MAITNFRSTIWHAALLDNFHQNTFVLPTLNHDYEGDIQNGGEAVKITGFTQPTIGAYSGTITTQALTDSTQSLLINQKDYFSFQVDDVDRVQAAGSFDPITADAGAGLADTAENYVLSQLLANGTSAGTTAVTTPSLAFAAVMAIRTALVKAKVPTSERYLVVNPDAAAFLMGEASKLLPVDSSGSSDALRNGVIGRLLGFAAVIESPSTTIANTAKPCFIGYHGRSVAFADQLVKTRATVMEAAFADQIAGLHVYGAKVLRATAVQTYVSV